MEIIDFFLVDRGVVVAWFPGFICCLMDVYSRSHVLHKPVGVINHYWFTVWLTAVWQMYKRDTWFAVRLKIHASDGSRPAWCVRLMFFPSALFTHLFLFGHSSSERIVCFQNTSGVVLSQKPAADPGSDVDPSAPWWMYRAQQTCKQQHAYCTWVREAQT